MAIITGSGGVGGSGGTGTGSIAKDMYFADTAARDQFTTDNPDRIYQGVTCAVVNGTSYDYFQYDDNAKDWKDANLIFQGKEGEKGEDGVDVTSAKINQSSGHLEIQLSDGTNIDAGIAKGKDGDLVYELLDVNVYGDFYAEEWVNKGTNIYGVTGVGNQFSNTPYSLVSDKIYSFEILLVNEANQYSMRVTVISDEDNANSGRESVLAGNTKDTAQTIGWRTLAFTSDDGHSDPADGFDLKTGKVIKVTNGSTIQLDGDIKFTINNEVSDLLKPTNDGVLIGTSSQPMNFNFQNKGGDVTLSREGVTHTFAYEDNTIEKVIGGENVTIDESNPRLPKINANVDISTIIDDSTTSDSKTYSSNKIESRIESDGLPNNGYVILNESYKNLKKGATYIYGKDDALSELPTLNSGQLNIVNFGEIYDENQNLFILASPDDNDGIWCWTRVAGGSGGNWFRVGSYNDMLKLDAITNIGSGKIITDDERSKIANSKDPSQGFTLETGKSIEMSDTSSIQMYNDGNKLNLLSFSYDRGNNQYSNHIGDKNSKVEINTSSRPVIEEKQGGSWTLAYKEETPHPTTEWRLSDEVRPIGEDELYEYIDFVIEPLTGSKVCHIVTPSRGEWESKFYIPNINEDKKYSLPNIKNWRMAFTLAKITYTTEDSFLRISSKDDLTKFLGGNDVITGVQGKRWVAFWTVSDGVESPTWDDYTIKFSPLDSKDFIPYEQYEEQGNVAYTGVPSNLNVQIIDGVGYQRVDRQYPVITVDPSTPKFRLLRTVSGESDEVLPTVKMIQPPELGSGFSFIPEGIYVEEGSQILQISSGTYSMEDLGVDPSTVNYGDEVYVQPDGSISTDFTRYQCGWVITDGIIIDIDIYNASALSEGGFPTDPVFNSVTTNLFRSSVSPNNALQFIGSDGILKTNADLELIPTSSLKFKVGGTQKAVLTSTRLDMNNTPISNVPNAVLDYDVAGWKQIRDYVDSHVSPLPDDLIVNSVIALDFVDTPIISAPSTDLSVKVSDEEVANFSLGSLDLKADANNNNGTNVTGVYKIIGANNTSHIAIPNENMVLHAKEIVAFQDQGSDYLYVDRAQGINFAGTTSGLIPDYSGNGAYLKGNKVGIKNWSGNDVITIDKDLGDVINVNSHRIENVLAPQFDTDATNKKFVTDIRDGFESRISALESTVASQEEQISGLLSSIISLNQDVAELIESNKQSVTNFVMYSETPDTLRMDMDRIGGQGLTQTVQFGNAPVPPNPEPPLPDEVAVYYGWDINAMDDMQADDFLNYQGTDERTANLYITADTLLTTDLQITRSNAERYKYSYIAYPKGLVDPDPLKVVYSGFTATWLNREMVIDGHTYIVLVSEYPNINATMDMKLSY